MAGLAPSLLLRFLRDRSAGTAQAFAVLLPAALGIAAVALDYGSMSTDRAKMQTAADIAALNSARELQFANADPAKVTTVANAYVQQSLVGANLNGVPQTSVAIINNNTSVQVSLTETYSPQFSGFIFPGTTSIGVTAVAHIANAMPVCLIGLDTVAKGTVYLEAQAKLQAPGCALYADSSHPWGFMSKDVALVTAGLICSAGGKFGGTANFNPQPMTDCPVIPDPLSARQPPSFGGCTAYNTVISGNITTLSPGTYCGGLTIVQGARVTLQPGIYVIKDGPLNVGDDSKLMGTNVGFYLTGSGSVFTFGALTTISLTAPKDGALAGFLFFEDRNVAAGNVHQILSDNARMLLGTIYLSNSTLKVEAGSPVADQSAYTVIVAWHVELYAGPTVVMNSNYNGTDIPVPEGVGPVGGKVTLTN